jgi:hypothetical protein
MKLTKAEVEMGRAMAQEYREEEERELMAEREQEDLEWDFSQILRGLEYEVIRTPTLRVPLQILRGLVERREWEEANRLHDKLCGELLCALKAQQEGQA